MIPTTILLHVEGSGGTRAVAVEARISEILPLEGGGAHMIGTVASTTIDLIQKDAGGQRIIGQYHFDSAA